MTNENRNFKDSMFSSLFRDEGKLIELYNAIENKAYPSDTKVEINTLEGVLFLEKINDISFMIEDQLVVLIENQSTVNPNMPLRFLHYLTKMAVDFSESKIREILA